VKTYTTQDHQRYVYSIACIAALGGLLFGYDTAVISGAIGFLRVRFALNAAQTGWAASSALVGCVIGVVIAGVLSDRIGRKKVLVLSAVLFTASAIGTALAERMSVFIAFRIIGGFGIGAASMTSPLYISEISPAWIRGRLVSVNQFAIVTGMLVVYFVNYFIARSGNDAWNVDIGWRWMFGSGALPAAVFLVLLFLVPESPRWLVGQKETERAFRVLSRVGGNAHAERELREIRQTLIRETVSLTRLLEPGFRIVLWIGIVLAVLQQVTGINVFLYYAPEIFKKLGAGTDTALLQTAVVGTVNMLFTVIAIGTVDRIGRRPLMLAGACGMGASLFAIGLAAALQKTELWILFFMLLYIASFALSVGPVTWVILSEIFPTGIRGRAMSIATVCLWAANWVVSQTFPMLNENAVLIEKFHHGFTFWIYGLMCIVQILFVWRFVPETKGKTLEDIEKHWVHPSS